MSAGLGVFRRVRISTRIYAGFGAVLLLLTGLGIASFLSLEGADQRTHTLVRVEENAAAVHKLSAEVALFRLEVLYYNSTGVEGHAKAARAAAARLQTDLRALADTFRGTEEAALAANMADLMRDYAVDFEKLTELRAQRDRIIAEQVRPTGSELVRVLNAAAEVAGERHGFEAAALLGQIDTHLRQADVHVYGFLAKPDAAQVEAFHSQVSEVTRHLAQLRALPGAAAQELPANIDASVQGFADAFAKAAAATLDYTRLRNESLRPKGEQYAALAAKLVDSADVHAKTLAAETDATNDDGKLTSLVLTSLALLLGILAATLIARAISRPVRQMTAAMAELAAGNQAIAVPALDRSDEIGEMGKAVEVFKQNAIERTRLESEQAVERAARERRQKAVDNLIQDFSATMGGSLGAVGASSSQMLSTSSRVADAAEITQREVREANQAASFTSDAVQAVAAAADELSASIGEISTQVVRTAEEAGGAAGEAKLSRDKVATLVATSQTIGQIVELINGIAAQTNLLALNATIEAARAGEVKSLASQTARATEDIAQQVATIQNATSDAAHVIETVAARVETISSIASAVAAAVEEQGAATKEIAARAQEVAMSTAQVTTSVGAVQEAAESSGLAAAEVRTAAEGVSSQAVDLQREIEHFLTAVRSTDDRRRFERMTVRLRVNVRFGGSVREDEVVDISAGGARLATRHPLERGTPLELELPGFGAPIRAKIAGVTDSGTHLQFPLDPAHLQRVEAFLQPMRKAA